jgi:AcrR family transcriptional regulator
MTSTERKAGRPRDVGVDAAILQAALQVLEEVGLGALSMDAVAARAGVGKATIYRRWKSKEDMVIDAVASLVATAETPATGSIHTDLVMILKRLGVFMSHAKGGSVFPWLVSEVAAGSEVGRHYAEAVIVPRRRALKQLLEAAQSRGDLRSDLDLEVAVDMITGPVILRKLFGSIRPNDPLWEEKLVDGLLAGWQS